MAGEVYDRVPGNIFAGYERIQVNHPEPDEIRIATFSRHVGIPCIAQTRTGFPEGSLIGWLFDASGGRGVAPQAWPRHPGRVSVGYAGGIGPENVREVLAAIGATGPYWIDMESGVRTDDRFDIGKCERVCEAVYGARATSRRSPPPSSKCAHGVDVNSRCFLCEREGTTSPRAPATETAATGDAVARARALASPGGRERDTNDAVLEGLGRGLASRDLRAVSPTPALSPWSSPWFFAKWHAAVEKVRDWLHVEC
jgi:hypothetical protein